MKDLNEPKSLARIINRFDLPVYIIHMSSSYANLYCCHEHTQMKDVRLEDDWVPKEARLGPAELEEGLRVKPAQPNAVFIESLVI